MNIYRFAYRLFLSIVLFTIFGSIAHSDWSPITGRQQPPFGTTEVSPARPENWTPQTPGYYFIEPNNINASDLDNSHGYLPNPIPPGSVVELRGPFDNGFTINTQGTVSNSVYVRGATYVERPQLAGRINFLGSYLIVENIKTEPLNASIGASGSGISIDEGGTYIALRHIEILNTFR